mmetsp:Transcript_17184/g.41835  ORF Transcript_17184/g.41835 Transcript_17184/m.41835 type:complete len:264 (+) Transcript_17184:92-883(+)
MFAELSTSAAITMSPISTCSALEYTTSSSPKSPVHVLDFTSSDPPKKTAMVVIPKCFLPDLRDDSLASALAKGVALTSTSNTETATFSCTEDSSASLSSISTDDGSTTAASSTRRAIFSPYWEKSGQEPVEMIPTGATDEEEAAIRSLASSVQSWSYHEIRELQRLPRKPRLVKSDTALVRPMPPSILRKSKYTSGRRPRRHTTAGTKSEMDATSMAIAGALATIEAESPRVKFKPTVAVRLFSSERPMEEQAEPGWSKLFTN